MPKGSEELTNARKEEIMNACASLYETMGLNDITICDIGAKTSFTRTSIYNYFQTKEEIFLALLQRSMRRGSRIWRRFPVDGNPCRWTSFAHALASTLEKTRVYAQADEHESL